MASGVRVPRTSPALSPVALRIVTAAALLMGVGGCLDPFKASSKLTAWIVEGSRQVGPTGGRALHSEIYTAADKTVRIIAAVNETVAFQLVISTDQPPAGPFNISVSDLTGPGISIGARDWVSIYRAHYVPIEKFRSWYPQHTGREASPTLFADPLVPWHAPRGGGPITLETTRNEIVWIDIQVPPTAAPGEYDGRLELTPVGETNPKFACGIRLRVLPVAIPSERSLPFICRVDPSDLFRAHLRWRRRDIESVRLLPDEPSHQAAVRLINNTMRLFQSHRLNPVLWGSFPKFRPTGQREVSVEWEPYDRLVEGWITGDAFDDRVGLARWPIPVSARYPAPDRQGGFDSPAYARLLSAYLTECRDHYAQRGWLEKSFVRMQPPAELSIETIARVKRLGGILRQSETGLSLVAHLPPRSLRGLGWHNAPQMDLSDIGVWAPPAMWSEPQALARERSLDRRTWFMPDEPPYSGSLAVEAPATDARVLPWHAYRYHADAVWVEHAARFGRSPMEPDKLGGGAHDALIYPGTEFGLIDTPVGSIRLKRLRRGLYDYELLRLLERHGRSFLAAEITGQIVRFAQTDAALNHLLDTVESGWASDPSVFELARELMLQGLASLFEPERSGGSAIDRRWASLMNRADRIHTLGDGVRLALEDNKFVVRAYVSVSNNTTNPLAGRWQSAEPPVGWKQRPAAQLTVVPGARVLDALVFDIAAPASNPDGVSSFQLNFETERHGAFVTSARLAVAVCPQVEDPPTIDGDLSDWIRVSNNAAADFRLCRGRRPAPLGGRENVPSAATLAMFCHDGRFLYVAVRCELPEGERPLWQADNAVPVDGIVPWGQDVVEILINPDNVLEGSSSDIYNLQIKPSGLIITSHGCRTDPPVGRTRAWRPEVELRVKTEVDAWTLELRLPLSALGPRVLDNRIWGFNVTRLDARRGEYSSWSAARRHCYSPQSMGNLILLRP